MPQRIATAPAALDASSSDGSKVVTFNEVRENPRVKIYVRKADEALAMVVVEASGRPLVVSNADLTSTRAGGLQSDLAATFLDELADAAGLTIHVRLIEGKDSQHVLSAIFKALGIALANATRGEA